MSGLVTAGVLLCGVHIANAQTNIDSGYTVLIPSEVTIDKESSKGSFSVSGKMDAQTELDVTTTSQNNYKLKCGSQFVDYTLDKQSFHIDNIKSANPKSFNEDFNITLANTNTNYSGNYKDRLTFNIVNNAYTYELDLNSVLDGVNNYSVHDYGTADIYINEEKVADDVSDWGGKVHYGDTYEIKDIKGTTGHHYSGASDGENNLNNFPLKGKIGIDTKHVENSKGILYSSIFLKFYTNTYTVKYDSNGGNGSMADTVHKYYKSDKMDGVIKLRKNTFTKTGYKFQGWYLTRVINKEIYYLYDNWQWYKEGTQPFGTKKCLYEDERRTSNATTVDKDVITAVAQWSPITYTIKYDGNGADSGVMENTTHIYHASSAESGVVHLRKNTFKKSGYSFSGWVFSKKINGETYYLYNNGQYNNLQWHKDNEQPAGVEKYIYNDSEGTCNATTIDGDTITAIAQWEKMTYSTGTVLEIEGKKYIVMSKKAKDTYLVISGESIGNMQFQPNVDSDGNYKIGVYETPDEKRPDGQYSNTYEGSYIDNYLENTWYKQLPEKLQKAIQTTDIKQASYSNFASNPKWKWFDPNGGSSKDWYYNEGTTENPKWVYYTEANVLDDEQGFYPLNCWKYSEKGYNDTTYNTISRHVFLPSVEEVFNLVNLNNANKVYSFLEGTNNSSNRMWFRDSCSSSFDNMLYLYNIVRSMYTGGVTAYPWIGVRPAFVVDLSKVDATVVDTVNYK